MGIRNLSFHPTTRGELVLKMWDTRDRGLSDQKNREIISKALGIPEDVVRVFVSDYRSDKGE